MIQDLWFSFPSTIEERIQGLLDSAEPNPTKAFHLYKTCLRSQAFEGPFEKFQSVLFHFFGVTPSQRKKSFLDRYLLRPLDAQDFSQFKLSFHSASVNALSLQELANWTYNLMRVGLKIKTVILNQDLIHRALYRLTHPAADEKGDKIRFRDFYETWGITVKNHYGEQYANEVSSVLAELQWLETQQKEVEEASNLRASGGPLLYLTQTEIYWVQDTLLAIQKDTALPKFPLSRGPAKTKLCELERTIKLYRIVQSTRLPELLLHKEKIRNTLVLQCHNLLQSCDRGIAS